MFFYSESIETILRKQNLSAYIESFIVNDKSERKVMPSPKLVQVVTSNSVSDGVFDYPCIFTSEKFKKGSFLRMVKWQINTRNCDLTIHEAQYLGGAGCEVQHGRKWDNDKLKMLANSRILSKYFVILHEPTIGVAEKGFPEFTYNNLNRAFASKKEKATEPKEKFEKKRISFNENQPTQRKKVERMEVEGETSALPTNISKEVNSTNLQ